MNDDDKIFLQDLDLDGINEEFVKTCITGDLERVQYLLTSPYLKHHAQLSITRLEAPLSLACFHGHLDIVQYFLTEPIFKKHIYIHGQNNDALISACTNGHLNIVKYLLSSEDFEEHANIHARNDLPFKNACYYGHLEIVEYLLLSSEIKEHSYIYSEKYNNNKIFDKIFSELLENKNKGNHYLDVIKFFIFDYKINYTPEIKNLVKFQPDIQKMFDDRAFHDKLNITLTSSDSAIKKVQKI